MSQNTNFYHEFEIPQNIETEVIHLLDICFPNTFYGRSFFKQLPHARYLVWENDILIAQIGLDYRAIKFGEKIVKSLCVIDLCVLPKFRNQGIATKLLQRVKNLAIKNKISALTLFADTPHVYLKFGFLNYSSVRIRFLAIDDEKQISHSVMNNIYKNCFMAYFLAKDIEAECYDSETVDLLGYLF
jgi:predicted acetyltransferase